MCVYLCHVSVCSYIMLYSPSLRLSHIQNCSPHIHVPMSLFWVRRHCVISCLHQSYACSHRMYALSHFSLFSPLWRYIGNNIVLYRVVAAAMKEVETCMMCGKTFSEGRGMGSHLVTSPSCSEVYKNPPSSFTEYSSAARNESGDESSKQRIAYGPSDEPTDIPADEGTDQCTD
jgi:hypothetical protein